MAASHAARGCAPALRRRAAAPRAAASPHFGHTTRVQDPETDPIRDFARMEPASTLDPDDEARTAPSRGHEHDRTRAPRPAAASGDSPTRVGRYQVLRTIGQGGMGVVYTAYDATLDRIVALKMLRGDRSGPAEVGRFIREARALARLSHPNIVAIHEVGAASRDVFLAMEYVRGQTLRQRLASRGGPLPVVAIFTQVARGLQAVHQAGLVHRDVKPDNIMLPDDGRVRLMDFGLVRKSAAADEAEAESGEEPHILAMTAAGAVIGTPAYMAPEQHLGREADARSDIYGLCATLYEALYGEPPIRAHDYASLRSACLAGAIRPPDDPRVPAWLASIVLRGLQVDPAARWPDVQALLDALEADPVAARRRRVRLALLVTVVTALAVALTAGVMLLRRAWSEARLESLAAERLAAVEAEPDPALAERGFQAFVADPANQRTQALARAWLRRGDQRLDVGETDQALASYARAYAEAPRPRDADEALVRLARVSLDEWDNTDLARLASAVTAAPGDTARTDLVVDVALRRRDLAGAASLLETHQDASLAAAAPLLKQLAHARALDHSAYQALVLPPGGPEALALLDWTEHELVFLDRELRPTRRWRSDPRISALPGTHWAVTQDPGVATLIDLSAPTRPLARFPAAAEPGPRAALRAPDGSLRALYFSFSVPLRGFHVLHDPTGHATVGVAHAASARTGSDLEAMTIADLDGDGVDEVIAAFGPHRAYDLRVFHADAAGDLQMIARRQIGHVAALGPLRRPDGRVSLVAALDTRWPNADVFPDAPHVGAPIGIHLLEWTGTELRTIETIPAPDHATIIYSHHVNIDDLDGDGVDDLAIALVVGRRSNTQLVHQAPDGALRSLIVGDARPLAVAELDGDPARELIVADADPSGQTWVLGLGSAPMPPVSTTPYTSAPPPPDLTDDVLVARWDRADELGASGLPASGAELLRDAAAFVADARLQRRLRDRAAALYASAGQLDAAIELSVAALADRELAPGALTRRIDALTGLGRFEEARRDALALRDTPGLTAPEVAAAEATLARLTSLLAAADVVDLNLADPLPAAMRIDQPAALRHDRGAGALRIEAVGSPGALATLPVRRSGGAILIEAELDITRAEYATGLDIILSDETGRAWMAVGFGAGGHRFERHQSFACQAFGGEHLNYGFHSTASAATPRRVVLRAVYFPDRAVTACATEGEGLRYFREYHSDPAALSGPLNLQLRVRGEHLIGADLRRLTLRGLRDAPPEVPPAPLEEAARALVQGDPLRARTQLASLPPDAEGRAQLELLAADDLRDSAAIQRFIAAAFASLRTHERIHLLRTRPGLAAAILAAAGARALSLLAAAWVQLARHHFDDPDVQRRLLGELHALERLEVPDDAERQALGELLFGRGGVRQSRGEHQAAQRDWQAALATIEAITDDPARRLRANLHAALTLSLAPTEPARAREHGAAALAHDDAPALVQDRLRRDPTIAALAATDPAWASLVLGPPPGM